MRTALVPGKEQPRLPLLQTKPECYRKEGAYKNMLTGMSKIGVDSGQRCRSCSNGAPTGLPSAAGRCKGPAQGRV